MTQSRLVIRSLLNVNCSYSARERPWISRAAHLVADELRADRDAVVLRDVQMLGDDLAGLLVHLDVRDDARLVPAKLPKPKPRPVTTSPLLRFDAATFGFQPAACVARVDHRRASVRRDVRRRRCSAGGTRSGPCSPRTRARRRSARWRSTAAARSGPAGTLHLNAPPYSGCVFASTRRVRDVVQRRRVDRRPRRGPPLPRYRRPASPCRAAPSSCRCSPAAGRRSASRRRRSCRSRRRPS